MRLLKQESRMADRVRMTCPAYLRQGNSFDTPATLLDISTQGFRCEFLYRASWGEEVVLVLRDVGEFPAKIEWKVGKGVGASFLTPLGWRHLTSARAASRRQTEHL